MLLITNTIDTSPSIYVSKVIYTLQKKHNCHKDSVILLWLQETTISNIFTVVQYCTL